MLEPMSTPCEAASPLTESTREGGAARERARRASGASLQRPSTPSHVWFAFDRWLEVADQGDEFVLA